MGKTYETFGVISTLLRHQPNARIVVLAHSRSMADTWLRRWNHFRQENVASKHRENMAVGELLPSADEIGKPGLFFGSYETFKIASTNDLRAMLEWVFDGSGLHEPTRRRWRWRLFHARGRGGDPRDRFPRCPSREARLMVRKMLDEDASPYRILHELRCMVLRSFRTKRQVDLLVVDEAHKVRDGQRKVFFTETLNRRAAKVLYVTATPFALDLEQLVDLVRDMFECVGVDTAPVDTLKRSLLQFQETVEARRELAPGRKAEVQRVLGAYLVRSCWRGQLKAGARRQPVGRRKIHHLKGTAGALTEERALASLALETAFRHLQGDDTRVHRAAHRETLCSSYSAIREAAKRAPSSSSLGSHLRTLVKIIPAGHESPKLQAAKDFLIKKARQRCKVVVFCKRLATVRKLRNELHHALEAERDHFARLWKLALRKLSRIGAEPEIRELTRMAIYSGGKAVCPASANTRKKLKLATAMAEPDRESRTAFLSQTWGPHRHIDWVAELTGDTHQEDGRGRSPEAVRFAFNLPGPPYILLCTNIAREGIDLHHWCRCLMHYDLEWNPAFMEQQVGRVDRLGSYSSRVKRPIQIVFVYQTKTYEERIAQVVQHRCEMLRVLLGAGQWLADDPEQQQELSNLERYRMDFSP